MSQKLTTGFYLLSGVLFILFAAVQYNDPDPQVWIFTYMLVSLISFISIYRNIPWYLTTLILIPYLAGAIILWPDTYFGITMPMSYKPEIELARESLGLGISSTFLLIIAILSYKNSKKLELIKRID